MTVLPLADKPLRHPQEDLQCERKTCANTHMHPLLGFFLLFISVTGSLATLIHNLWSLQGRLTRQTAIEMILSLCFLRLSGTKKHFSWVLLQQAETLTHADLPHPVHTAHACCRPASLHWSL